MTAEEDPHDQFPVAFFSRADESNDTLFYAYDRFVTHIDDRAIRAVGRLYQHLGIDRCDAVLDVMSSWVSHFIEAPAELVILGMNEQELAANPQASSYVVHDLNVSAAMPFADDRFDAATCCVSIDYLVRPIDVLRELGRVVTPGGTVVCTFSNRCFPTKVVRGWLSITEDQRCQAVAQYFRLANVFDEPEIALCTPPGGYGDPLYAVWAKVSSFPKLA